jgi:hypothetical protein
MYLLLYYVVYDYTTNNILNANDKFFNIVEKCTMVKINKIAHY